MARADYSRELRRAGRLVPRSYRNRGRGRQGDHPGTVLRRDDARRAGDYRRRIGGAEKRPAAEDRGGQIYRHGRDRGSLGPLRRRRNRGQGGEEGLRLYDYGRKILRARRARRRRDYRRRAHWRRGRRRNHTALRAGEGKRRHGYAAQDRRYDAADVPRQIRQRRRQRGYRRRRRRMADSAPHARYRDGGPFGRDGG